MRVQEAYDRWSSTYDTGENLTRDLDQVVTRAILGGSQYRSILEIGCGTGKNTGLLAQIGERVFSLKSCKLPPVPPDCRLRRGRRFANAAATATSLMHD